MYFKNTLFALQILPLGIGWSTIWIFTFASFDTNKANVDNFLTKPQVLI